MVFSPDLSASGALGEEKADLPLNSPMKPGAPERCAKTEKGPRTFAREPLSNFDHPPPQYNWGALLLDDGGLQRLNAAHLRALFHCTLFCHFFLPQSLIALTGYAGPNASPMPKRGTAENSAARFKTQHLSRPVGFLSSRGLGAFVE